MRVLGAIAAVLPCLPLAASGPPNVIYTIETVAGSDEMGDNGPAVEAQLRNVYGLAVDQRGNLYIADTDGHRIRRVTPDGRISTVAGSGRPGFSGDEGPAVAARLHAPYSVAVDPDGNLYIADTYNHRIRKVGQDGRIRTVAGTGEKGSAESGLALTSQLMAPRNLAFDAAGNLFVSEFEGHRVRRISPDGRIRTVAGTGVAGFKGDGGPAELAQLSRPAGIAVDRLGTIYISDTDNRVVRRVIGGTIDSAVPLNWNYDGGASVAVDPSGALVVSDEAYRIRRTDSQGRLQLFAGSGSPSYNGEDKPASEAGLAPRAFTFDSAGNCYVAEPNRIRKIEAGRVRSVAGDGSFGFRGDGGLATRALLFQPSGIALGPDGDLLIADSGNHRLRRVNGAGMIHTLAGPPESGALLTLPVALNTPEGLAVDSGYNLLVTDPQGFQVLKISPSGQADPIGGKLGRCVALGADNNSIDDVPVCLPMAIAAGPAGSVYIADTGHHRVLKVAPGGTARTYAGNGSQGFAGDGGKANLAQLNNPAGLAVDGAGNLYIADRDNHRVRRVDENGIIETVAGNGIQGFSGDGGPAREASLDFGSYGWRPGLAVDAEGNLYISDCRNHRVRKVGTDGIITTIAGDGWQGFEGDGGPAAKARLYGPAHLAVDARGQVYVSDYYNHRVRKLTPKVLQGGEIQALSVLNAASLLPGPIAPGEIVSIFGGGLGPKAGAGAKLGSAGVLETRVAEVEVRFNGRPAPLFYVQESQINAQAPYELAGEPRAVIEVAFNGNPRGAVTVPVAEAAPGLFAIPGDPKQGVIINEDWSVNSELLPARRNSVITIYATGEGLTTGENVDGKPAPSTPPFPRPLLPVTLTIGGYEAAILYAGSAPGFAGLMQINARVPGGFLPSGRQPVVLTVGRYSSQPGISMAVE